MEHLKLFANLNRSNRIHIYHIFNIINYFTESWQKDPLKTLQIILYIRSIKNGLGNKFIGRFLIFLVKIINIEIYREILPDFIKEGSWKDLLYICDFTNNTTLNLDNNIECKLFIKQLKSDLQSIKQTPTICIQNCNSKISLCAKWAPNENSKYHSICKNIIELWNLERNSNEEFMNYKSYRKMLGKLRLRLNIIEQNLSQKNYDINFKNIPSSAHFNYKKTFLRTYGIKDNYQLYLNDLQNGNSKICSSSLEPHIICNKILQCTDPNEYIVLEEMWNSLVNDIKSKGSFKNTIAISDVSGSMSGIPMEVSIALGLLVSECCEEPYKNCLITFSQDPSIIYLEETSIKKFINTLQYSNTMNFKLKEKLTKIKNMPWGMNTDLLKVFQLLLDIAIKNKLKKEEMIEQIIIFTDMQFDNVCPNYFYNINNMYKLYSEHNYTMPKIICWNLRNVDFIPVNQNSDNILLLSGYSKNILKNLFNNNFTNPIENMNNILNQFQINKNIADFYYSDFSDLQSISQIDYSNILNKCSIKNKYVKC